MRHVHVPPKEEGGSTFTSVERMLGSAALEAERTIVAYRETAFHRFPALFGILVLVGGVVTVFGFEQLLTRVPFFYDHPARTLIFGLIILGATGALYKRLSI